VSVVAKASSIYGGISEEGEDAASKGSKCKTLTQPTSNFDLRTPSMDLTPGFGQFLGIGDGFEVNCVALVFAINQSKRTGVPPLKWGKEEGEFR
jgi:hypothetical protein